MVTGVAGDVNLFLAVVGYAYVQWGWTQGVQVYACGCVGVGREGRGKYASFKCALYRWLLCSNCSGLWLVGRWGLWPHTAATVGLAVSGLLRLSMVTNFRTRHVQVVYRW
jgi:hypothetical protein